MFENSLSGLSVKSGLHSFEKLLPQSYNKHFQLQSKEWNESVKTNCEIINQ